MQHLMGLVRRCVDDYDMIKSGDRIAVGVSGGKDSLCLLETLAEMRRFYPKKYELVDEEGKIDSVITAVYETLNPTAE